ncbi:unnamed protein product [Euphydryas editha]|uniref:Reverse transcriptase domain-containing protein n=1 Tax=Euphydryas editha TaxID=104508 RepID=A0AAU9V4B5_EUPED|nr:unnamed protein product [Euphydryas editha]
MENKRVIILVLIDFSNEFNAVDHDLLLACPANANVSSSAMQWFLSYLRGSRQAICMDQNCSNWCWLNAGISQGGILSSVLFSMFINSVTSRFTSSYLYTDDLQLYQYPTTDSLADTIAALNRDLTQISQ